MSYLIATLLTVFAALLQLGIAQNLFQQPLAAPIFPLVIIAGWGAMRGLGEIVPGAALAAIALGVASEERTGWFLFAMLPTVLLILPALALRPSQRMLLAPVAAALGVIAYQGLLYLVNGVAFTAIVESDALLRGTLYSAAASLLLASACWALRPQPPDNGLFI